MIVSEKTSSPLCLFFIHGMLCDANDWKAQIDYFSEKYHVVSCDLPGHGTLSHSTTVSCDIPSLATYVKSVIDSLTISQEIILIGHSMATRIVIELCLLLNRKVSSIILLDMGYQITAPTSCTWIEEEHQRITHLGYQNWLDQFFNTKFGSSTPQALRNAVMAKAKNITHDIGTALYLNTKVYDYYALEKALRLLTIPVLILQASFYYQGMHQDRIKDETPKSDWLSLVSDTLPQAQVEILENCGHWIMMEQPNRCNRLIDDFLSVRISNQ